tara:strand:- start:151 stop:357 length:207 start_codon:yes stop_codon:yes gene_type:complete
VVVVAEGAGEELLGKNAETDKSGNPILPKVGEFLKKEVTDFFNGHGLEATVKYIDPSYVASNMCAYSL